MSRTMTKPKKLRDSRMEADKDERVLPVLAIGVDVVSDSITVDVVPVPKRYTPPNCSACTALRPRPEESYVSVYHTRREDGFIFHYCKCGFCNNTFKDSERI